MQVNTVIVEPDVLVQADYKKSERGRPPTRKKHPSPHPRLMENATSNGINDEWHSIQFLATNTYNIFQASQQ